VISHEFFGGASAEQAARAVAAFPDAEVHLVVTARDTLNVVTSYWQEYIKHGFDVPLEQFPSSDETRPADEWSWRSLDLGGVLEHWAGDLDPSHVHVLVLPGPGSPREALWERFAAVVGIETLGCSTAGSNQYESLGVVEVELLRRINADLKGFDSALNRGVWIRGYLGQGKLVPRKGEKFWPGPARIEQLRARGERAVAYIREQGYDVIGDLDDLRTPTDLPDRRHPSSVTDTEMLAAATSTIAAMMTDVRRLTNQQRRTARRSGLRARIRARARLRQVADRLRVRSR
jgi:hypothetical protein